MVYKPREIDLDLFVNAASKGFNDGAKVPSPFASFVNAFSEGIDQNYKNALEEQQTEQIRIHNEQAPFETTIKENQAMKAQLETEAMQQNPDAFKSSIIRKAEADRQQIEQQAIQQQKKTDLTTIMGGDDGEAKGTALLSGKYDDILSPALKQQYIDSTYTQWGDQNQAVYQDMEFQKRQRESNAKLKEQALIDKQKTEQDFLGNSELSALAKEAGNLSMADMLEKGKIVSIPVPPLDSTDKTDGFGNVIYERKYLPGQKPDMIKVFQYDGKQYDLGGVGVSNEAFNTFNKSSTNYNLVNDQNRGQGGPADKQRQAEQQKSVEAKKNAEATLNYEETASRARAQQDSFNEGAKVAAPYQDAANTVKNQIAEARAKSRVTPQATPDLTVEYNTKEPAVLPQGRDTIGSGVKTEVPSVPSVGTPEPVFSSFTITPGTASPIATSIQQPATTPFPTATPTAQVSGNSPAPTPGPEAQQANLKKQIANTKAEEIAKKYQQTNTPVPMTSPPVDQARQVTSSSFIPSKFTVNVPYKPQTAAIQRVASRPELQGFSAIAKAVAVQESGGNPKAVSETGVKDLMQVTGKTARDITPTGDFTNPVDNAMRGAIYIQKALSKPAFENNPMLALTSYNGGELVVAQAIRLAGGSTDWDKVKSKLIEAGNLPVVQAAWVRDGLDRKYLKTKPKQVYEYAEKVVANFSPFVYTRSDMELADKLKQQKVLTY